MEFQRCYLRLKSLAWILQKARNSHSLCKYGFVPVISLPRYIYTFVFTRLFVRVSRIITYALEKPGIERVESTETHLVVKAEILSNMQTLKVPTICIELGCAGVVGRVVAYREGWTNESALSKDMLTTTKRIYSFKTFRFTTQSCILHEKCKQYPTRLIRLINNNK